MSKTTPFPDIEKIEEQTSEWLAAIDRGLSESEHQQLQDWLSECPVHGETLVHMASVWDLMDLVAPVAKVLPLEELGPEFQSFAEKEAEQSQSWLSGWVPASAALAGLVVAVMAWVFLPQQEADTYASVYRTEIGEHSDVMLQMTMISVFVFLH